MLKLMIANNLYYSRKNSAFFNILLTFNIFLLSSVEHEIWYLSETQMYTVFVDCSEAS